MAANGIQVLWDLWKLPLMGLAVPAIYVDSIE